LFNRLAGAITMKPLLQLSLLFAAFTASLPGHAAVSLVDHVNGYTLDGAGKLQRFEALLIEDGKVLAVGSSRELAARSADAAVIDGRGRTLLPGLIDAHGHVMNLGSNILQADLVGTQSLDAHYRR
jgi:predicted amidohydrolase YtcJ